MRHYLFPFALLFLLASSVHGGEAQVQKTFDIQADMTNVVEWVKSHRAEIAESTKCTLVSYKGNKIRVVKHTAKGTYEFTLRETLKEQTNTVTYYLRFDQSHQGNMTKYDLTATISRLSSGTRISVHAAAIVDDPRVRDADVRVSMIAALRGFQRVMSGL
jgi:hypothetical protein